MSVTREQSMQNARTASAVIARSLGFYENDGSGFVVARLSPENQVKLTAELSRYVVANPEKFTAQALDVAKYHLSLPMTGQPLLDPDWTLSEFSDAFLDEARITLPNVGNKLLLAVVVVAVVYFGIKAWRSAPAAT
jgi:hypothetical protein